MVAARALSPLVLSAILLASLGACEGTIGLSVRGVRGEGTGAPELMGEPDARWASPDAAVPPPPPGQPPACVPSCAGRACGGDGCGGTCGSCTSPSTCSPEGQCLPPSGGATREVLVFGRVATCGACRAAHAYLDENGCTYRSIDLGDPGALEMYSAAVTAAGQSPRSSISMPAIVSTGGGFPGEVTYGWSTSLAQQHRVVCR